MINIQQMWDYINKFNPEANRLTTEVTYLKTEFARILKERNDLLDQKIDETKIDKYCKANFKTIPPIAYKQKRDIKGTSYIIALQELITPNAYEVQKIMRGIDRDSGNNLDIVKRIGDKIANYLTWNSDNNLSSSGDYYLMPSESIALKLCDCEDHAGVSSSCHPDVGMAWGFYKDGGHCFNVFCTGDILYILDTVADKAIIKEYDKQTDYRINYIVTRKGYYQVKGGVQFGTLAGWN